MCFPHWHRYDAVIVMMVFIVTIIIIHIHDEEIHKTINKV